MKFFPAFSILVTFLALGATKAVQTAPKTQTSSALLPLRDESLPRFLSQSLHARTLRSGTAPIGPRGASVWWAFLAQNAPQNAVEDVETPVTFWIGLPKSRSRVQTLQRLDLGPLESYQIRDMQLLWLYPARKIGPILLLPACPGHTLWVWPRGWNRKSRVQSFAYAPNSGLNPDFAPIVDKNGAFAITQTASPSAKKNPTFLHWNGKGWF